MDPVRVGVMGTGALGRHHTRLLAGSDAAELVGIYDLNVDLARRVAEEFGVIAFDSAAELMAAVEAMTVAVPASFHHGGVMPLLEAGIHVLVEKPLAPSSDEARDLVECARERNLVLAVGHVERFNPALSALRAVRGEPAFIEARRLALFPAPRPGDLPRNCDVSVIFDLMIHDIDLVLSLVNSEIADLQCVGRSLASDYIDLAFAWLRFENGCVAHLHASRASADPCRTLTVHIDNEQYCLELTHGDAHILRATKGKGVTVEPPNLVTWNALEEELGDFCRCVQRRRLGDRGAEPRVPGQAGLRAVTVAEMLERGIQWKTSAVGNAGR